MKIKIIAVLIAGVVIVAGGLYFVRSKTSSTANSSTQPTTASQMSAKKACDLFTPDDAKQIMGPNTVSTAGTAASNMATGNSDISVTTCTYNNTGTSTTATVLVRSALTSDGKTSNQAGYAQDKKMYKGSDVSTVGETAYYDTDLGQLEFIKGNNWIIVTSGGFGAANHSQAQATQIAQIMLQKL
ncbi:MAG TPA: hypothetical protein VNX65_04875 [Patescibacteria group bacterium]|jgi:hypothetical protein|nr:hypothetical protein [Patescibacteria group bacterium]